MADRVLVTGVSGFIAAHVTERLLAKGYLVRGTVRNKSCLLYTSPSPRDATLSRMPSSA